MSWRRFRRRKRVGELRWSARAALDEAEARGEAWAPVELDGRRTIAKTFWGKTWCDHFEAARDYANRLPRGRKYVRHNAVVDLQITRGRVDARVCGSRDTPYDVRLAVTPLPSSRWQAIVDRCGDDIATVIDLLEGRLGTSVIDVLCDPESGLMPRPDDLRLSCSCPDWASMCKHVAAVLYGVGARLDDSPELLFTLRDVDQDELVMSAGVGLETDADTDDADTLDADDDALAALFDIELADTDDGLNTPPTHRAGVEAEPDGPVLEPQGEPASEPHPVVWLGRAVDVPVPQPTKQRARDAVSGVRLSKWQIRLPSTDETPPLDPRELLGRGLDTLVCTDGDGAAWLGIALPLPESDDEEGLDELLEQVVDGEHFVWHARDTHDVLLWAVDDTVLDDPDAAVKTLERVRTAVSRGDCAPLRIGWLHAWARHLASEGETLLEEGVLDEIYEPVIPHAELTAASERLAELLGVPSELRSPSPRRGTNTRSVREVFADAGLE